MIFDYFIFAINSIRHRKLRSWLTVIGIVIGVAAIVSLIAISQGLENAITAQFEQFGANRIYVVPKGGLFSAPGTFSLDKKDVETLEKMSEFKWVNPFLSQTAVVEYGREKESLFVHGVNTNNLEEVFTDINLGLQQGRYFSPGEKNSVLIGYLLLEDVFKKRLFLNNQIEIEGVKMRVIGVFEKIGNEADDSGLFIPMETAREIFDKKDEVSAIELVVYPGLDLNEVANKVNRKLGRLHDNDDEFEVITPDQILSQLGSILLIIQVVLIGIAAISLIVGAVGITNSMYTSVLERTKDIGIMKSIGARNFDIMMIFLIESGLMGLTGGIIGVIVGSFIAKSVEFIAASSNYDLLLVKITLPLVLFGIAFAFLVGIISGTFPARQAAKLKPIEALRYGQ